MFLLFTTDSENKRLMRYLAMITITIIIKKS